MEKVFDVHAHYLFEIPIDETVRLFKREFEMAGIEKCNFLSLPFHEKANGYEMLYTQNVKGLYLKHSFSPNAYCFSGLEHPEDLVYTDNTKKDFLCQAEEYIGNGYDGFKMLEGYPILRKLNQIPLDHKVYDYFYSFMQENELPIIMHVANPKENWDISKASKYAIQAGRVCDQTYPSFEQLIGEVFGILKKFPKLKLILAHFGFLCYDVKEAERFLSYENTALDLTPGGEQILTQLRNWEVWSKFYDKYQDRIIYGTDFYAFPLEEEKEWMTKVMRRTNLVRQAYETTTQHEYVGTPFKGIGLDPDIRRKIYVDNAVRLFGEPRKIDLGYLKSKAQAILKKDGLSDLDKKDLLYIINNI